MDTQPLYVLIYQHQNNHLWHVMSLSKETIDEERDTMSYVLNDEIATVLFDGIIEVNNPLNMIIGNKAIEEVIIQAILTGKKEGQMISSNERERVERRYHEGLLSNRECAEAAHEHRQPFGISWKAEQTPNA